MATRRLFPTLSHKPVLSRNIGMSSKRHSSTTDGSQQRQARRPPKQQQRQQQQQQRQSANRNSSKTSRPTHFLALPIGHHPELRNAMSALSSSWLAHEPPIEGLDPSIVVHPRRLHLTLGVMALAQPDTSSGQGQGQRQRHDLAGATALLDSLAPRIRAVLAQSPLRVPLGRLAVMQSDPTRAHVLYAEPDLRSSDGRRLRAVCDLVHGAFKEAGFLADERRPLKLHCTILNTSYRRRTPGAQRRDPERIPFSFAAFPPRASDGEGRGFGTWTVDELQICEMGSWAPDGAYVRVAGCRLRPDT